MGRFARYGVAMVGAMALLLMSLFTTSAMGAVTYYASPSGATGVSTCPQSAPCALTTAIALAGAGDTVSVGAGTYGSAQSSLGGITISAAGVSIVGSTSGSARPQLYTTGVTLSGTGSEISDLTLQVGGGSLTFNGSSEIADQVEVLSSDIGCEVQASAIVVRDSVCDGASNIGLLDNVKSDFLYNDTLVGGISGISTGGTDTAENTIFSGGDTDLEIFANGDDGYYADVKLNYCEWATNDTDAPASDTNRISTAPTFVNAAGDDFHEASGSASVGAGTDDQPNTGSDDLDGNLRESADTGSGLVTDVGAYQLLGSESADTAPATDVTSTSATLNATINTGGAVGSYQIGYVPASGGSFIYTPAAAVQSNTAQTVSQPVTDLAPHTTYDLAVVLNGDETLDGSFTTPAAVKCTGDSLSAAYATTATVTPSCTGAGVTYSISSAPKHGSASVSGDQISYTPAAGYTGSDTVGVLATDSGGLTATDQIAVTVAKPVAPACAATTTSTAYVTAAQITPSCSGTGLTYAADPQNAPAHGTVTVSGSTATYTPAANFAGTDHFDLTATDAVGQSTSDPVTVTVSSGPAPTVVIQSPASGGDYTLNQAVPTSFSCTPAPGGASIASCLDAENSTSPGVLDTSSAGQHTYTVTATGTDGSEATASISYTVEAAPPIQPAPQPPIAKAAVTPGTAGLTYTFSAAGSGAPGSSITSYRWTLDGQIIGSAPSITHSFTQTGQPVTVLLTVTSANGTTASATVQLTPHGRRLTTRLVLHFLSDSATLTPTDRRELAKLRTIYRYASTVNATGYSAAREASSSHVLIGLSRERAFAAVEFLRADDNRTAATVRLTGYGASHFVASNRSPAGRAANRRAVLTIVYVKPVI